MRFRKVQERAAGISGSLRRQAANSLNRHTPILRPPPAPGPAQTTQDREATGDLDLRILPAAASPPIEARRDLPACLPACFALQEEGLL